MEECLLWSNQPRQRLGHNFKQATKLKCIACDVIFSCPMFSSGFRRERVFLFCCESLGVSCLPGKINFYAGACGLTFFCF